MAPLNSTVLALHDFAQAGGGVGAVGLIAALVVLGVLITVAVLEATGIHPAPRAPAL
jgi:hypothetical protein